MHFPLQNLAFSLCALGFSMAGLVLVVKIVRVRGRNRVSFARAVGMTFEGSMTGAACVMVMLLTAVAAVFTPLQPPTKELPTSGFLAPQRSQDEEQPTASARVVDVALNETESAGPAVQLNPSMSTDALQGAIARAPRGAHILFAAGTYHVTNTITIPCNGLHIAGPAGTPPTAVLSAQFKNSDIFAYSTGCADLGSIQYLHFENTGAVYLSGGDNSNFAFEHNLVTHLPSGLSNGGSESGLFFDGSLTTTLRNILIRDNTFGDAESCTAVFATPKDEGGYCSGIITSQGEVNNIRIEYNSFFHVENGVHFNQLAQWKPGQPNSVCVSCTVNYNYIANYHRIGIEIQTSTPTDSIRVEHNAVVDPVNSSWGTFAVSMACCQWGHNLGAPGFSPGYIFNDNVLIATLPIGSECPPYGVEFWGTGSQGMNSLVQGTFCNGYTWGYGAEPWAITHNYICGPHFATKGGYISDQQKQGNPPKQTDNLITPNCTATPSTAPTISPSGGPFTGTQQVTLVDKGLNTGIWYTTDGTTPVPGTGTARYYTGPFTVTRTTTVKAVGMWGAPHQPKTYPPGYGYVPSKVVSASFTSGLGTPPPQPRAEADAPASRRANV